MQRKKFQKSRRSKRKFSVLRLVSFFFLIIFGIFYLLQINQKSTFAYKSNALKKRINELQEEKELLELEASKLQSLKSVSQRLKGLKMVAVEQVEYWGGNESVAAK